MEAVVEEAVSALRNQLLNGLADMITPNHVTAAHLDMSVMLREREKTVAREERMLMRKQINMERQVETLRAQVQQQRRKIRQLQEKIRLQK